MTQSLHAPWRMQYIRSLESSGSACFLCDAANAATEAQRRDCLVLWATDLTVVLINRYPYTNGHLLVSPRSHKAELSELNDDELMDLQRQTVRVLHLLKRAQTPQGFNLGINLGRCAGAGVPGHLHQHVVPRWAGDTNFMTVVADIRVVPQATMQLYDELMRYVPEI